MATHAATDTPVMIITRTALLKLGKHVTRMGNLTIEQVTAWVRAGIAAGSDVDPTMIKPEVCARCVLLPQSYVADTGDRLVALCMVDRYNPGDTTTQVVTTVKRLRSVLKPVEHVGPVPLTPLRQKPFAVLSSIAPPVQARGDYQTLERAREAREASPPEARELIKVRRRARFKVNGPDNRGAQLARMEMAKRRAVHLEMAERLGIHARTFSDYVNGRQIPDIRAAVALRDKLGIPLDAWSESPT